MAQQDDHLKRVIGHAKEYGFVFPSSDIYDGLSAAYDYGQLGVELKNNIKAYWWTAMVRMHENIVGLDASIFMHPTTWKASGHVDAFNDPLIDNKDSKKRYRADVLIEDHIGKIEAKIAKDVAKAEKRLATPSTRRNSSRPTAIASAAKRRSTTSTPGSRPPWRPRPRSGQAAHRRPRHQGPETGSANWTDVRQFNLMFKTELGAVSGDAGVIYSVRRRRRAFSSTSSTSRSPAA